MTADESWMQRAIDKAREGIAAGQSPFGAVIVRDGRLVAEGHNEVWRNTDPTAHAEVVAIRRAAAALQTIDLSGCAIYTTCEPCPMCAAAIHWSRIDRAYLGATIADARRAGFRELTLAMRDLISRGGSRVQIIDGVLSPACAALFDEWRASPAARPY